MWGQSGEPVWVLAREEGFQTVWRGLAHTEQERTPICRRQLVIDCTGTCPLRSGVLAQDTVGRCRPGGPESHAERGHSPQREWTSALDFVFQSYLADLG